MKAIELMCLDIVEIDGEYCMVLSVNTPPNHVTAVSLKTNSDGNYNVHCRKEDNVKPVLITKDILRENGELIEIGDHGPSTPPKYFNRFEKWEIRSEQNKTNIWYDRTTKEYHIANSGADFKHVHILQHALRLVGLDDLANNLKMD